MPRLARDLFFERTRVVRLDFVLADGGILAEDLHVRGKDGVHDHREDGADAVGGGEEGDDTVAEALLGVGAVLLVPEGAAAGEEGGGAVGRAHVGKDVGHDGDADAHAEGDGEDHAVAAGAEVDRGHGLETGDEHVHEEEGGHAADDAVGDGGDDAGNLGEDAEEDEPDAARDASLPGRALGECDDAVVLGEGGVGHASTESGEEGADAVGEKATLDGLVELVVVVDGFLGGVVDGADVACKQNTMSY